MAGENSNQDDSRIGSLTASTPFRITYDYTFYLQCGNYNQEPNETVEELQNLWDAVYNAVVTKIQNSSGNIVCNFTGWTRQPDLRTTTDLKLNRQSIYSDLAVMTFEVFG